MRSPHPGQNTVMSASRALPSCSARTFLFWPLDAMCIGLTSSRDRLGVVVWDARASSSRSMLLHESRGTCCHVLPDAGVSSWVSAALIGTPHCPVFVAVLWVGALPASMRGGAGMQLAAACGGCSKPGCVHNWIAAACIAAMATSRPCREGCPVPPFQTCGMPHAGPQLLML